MPQSAPARGRHVKSFVVLLAASVLVGACAQSGQTAPSPIASARTPETSPSLSSSLPAGSPSISTSPGPTASVAIEPVFTPIPDASQAPDTGAGGAAGDVPDNAVFLTYHAAAWQFAIQYVEGWQVTTQPDGVVIRDKDSSETVQVVQKPANLQAWVNGTDVPGLQRQPGFAMTRLDRVKVGSATVMHLAYHALSSPDSVTGKQVPSAVDRFYVEGPALAVITLATPSGVDNVDAFRQIIGSFAWQAG